MIEDNKCGFPVEAGSPEAFADALEAAADDRANLKLAGDNSRKLARKKFDRNQLADEWVKWVTGRPPI
jgi:glycosyltransferase involved in cell wall biosynthesis